MGFLFVVMALRILQKKRHLARGGARDVAASGAGPPAQARLRVAFVGANLRARMSKATPTEAQAELAKKPTTKRATNLGERACQRATNVPLCRLAAWLAASFVGSLLVGRIPAALAVPPSGAIADESAPRVLFRAASAQDWQLATRIRGQTSDLPLELVEVPTPFLEERLRDQFRAAEALGGQTKATVILWRARAALFAFVTTPAPGYVVERKLGPPPGGDPSAFLEETALVARTLLRAVLEGALPRQTQEQLLLQEEPAATPATGPPIALASSWRAGLDGHLALLDDGLGTALGYGAAAGLLRDGSGWLLGVDWYATRDRTTIYADTVHFKRYAFFAQASSRFWHAGPVYLRAVGRVQMVITQIGLLSADTGLEDRVNRFRPVLTPAADVSLPLGGPLVLRVELALEVMPDPPALRTVRNGLVVEAMGPRVLSPRVAAGLELAWP